MNRKIHRVSKSKPTLEGAGVHLKRAIGFNDPHLFDPFLLLDDFRSDDPQKYTNGFPWHPHRGIETITYMLEGSVEHGDSMGNSGVIAAGDVQWMTAGNGIIHQEMPKGDSLGKMEGFQLWANLPASHKMMSPRYQEVKSSQMPVVTMEDGTTIRIVAGHVAGMQGPVRDIVIDPEYVDITVPAQSQYTHRVSKGYTVFAYVIAGEGFFGETEYGQSNRTDASVDVIDDEGGYRNETLILFADGDAIAVSTHEVPLRFLLCSGKPIGEPIAWSGPIVMNTRAELQQAYEELHNGTFIKERA
jgi:redox-sensitive bicupin YhaK (pirin superfamily)